MPRDRSITRDWVHGTGHNRGTAAVTEKRMLTRSEQLRRKREVNEAKERLEQREAGREDQRDSLLNAIIEHGVGENAHDEVKAFYVGWLHWRKLVRQAEDELDAIGREQEEDVIDG